MSYQVDRLTAIDLGKQGENLARTIEIDVSSMLAQWPNATFSILVKRKGDAEPYLSVCSRSGNLVRWPITSVETEVSGNGQMELRCTSGTVIAKSYVATIKVAASISGTATETPEPSQAWVDDVLAAADEVQALRADLITVRDNAQAAANTANAAAADARAAITEMQAETTAAVKDMNTAFNSLGLAVVNGLLCTVYE